MTVENVNILNFNYRGYMIIISFLRHCCGQKITTNKLWEWRVIKDGNTVQQQKEVNKKDAEVHALAWVDNNMSVEAEKVVKAEPIKNKNTSFEYKGFKVHILFCSKCNQNLTKKNWQWCITEGGKGESEDDVREAAKKWVDKIKGV